MKNQKSKIKNQKLISLFLIIILIGLLLPLVSLAASITECPPNATGDYNVVNEKGEIIGKNCFWGLVPCGGFKFDNYGNLITRPVFYDEDGNPIIDAGWKYIGEGKKAEIENPCQICHLFVMLDTIIDFALFRVLPPVATLMLVFGGIFFFGVAENPQKVEEAKKLLISVGMGLMVIYSAWVIITLFFIATGVMEPNIGIHDPTHWANVNCHIILD